MDDYDDDDKSPTPNNGGIKFYDSRNSSRASSTNLFSKTARERSDASTSSRATIKTGFQKNVPPRGTNPRQETTSKNTVARRSVSLRAGSFADKKTPTPRTNGSQSRNQIAKTTDDIRSRQGKKDQSKLVLDLDAIKTLVCEPCQQQDIDARAEEYCRTCEEALCDACSATHRNSKITRDHEVILLHEMSKSTGRKSKAEQYPSKPGKPEKISIESTTCTICWDPSTGPEVDYYEIRYKEKTSRTWSKTRTEGPECIFTVQNLKGRTAYNFQVRAISGSIEGPFGYVSEPFETKVSLAFRLMQSSRKIDDENPARYKLALDEKLSARNEKAKTRKCVLGQCISKKKSNYTYSVL